LRESHLSLGAIDLAQQCHAVRSSGIVRRPVFSGSIANGNVSVSEIQPSGTKEEIEIARPLVAECNKRGQTGQ
jgi:hypothetical protein